MDVKGEECSASIKNKKSVRRATEMSVRDGEERERVKEGKWVSTKSEILERERRKNLRERERKGSSDERAH